MSNRFQVARADGRSNTEVLCDLVQSVEPGRVLAYGELQDALASGTDRTYSLVAVQGVVQGALKMLAHLHKRALKNVPNQGYRVALAREHMELAQQRKSKARKQMIAGLWLLQHCRVEEMDEQTRMAHLGNLMLHEAHVQNALALDRRQEKHEKLIREAVLNLGSLMNRVEKLEEQSQV